MQNEINVAFLLTSFRTPPEDITRQLGIEPTETWKEGELISRTIRRHRENGWSIASGVDPSAELKEHLVRLLDLLRPVKELVRTLDDCDAEINIAIYANEFVPECHFEKEWLREIHELGAEIDIDFYCP